MQRLTVSGQPEGVPTGLVYRVAPDGPMGAKELVVQRSLAELGYPTPTVRLAGTDGTSTWSVMDFATGSPPLDGLDGLAALRKGPSILRQLPGQLAAPLARLHRLDPAPVSEAIAAEAPSVAWTVDDLLEHFGTAAEVLGRHELTATIRHLASTKPAGELVVCHGDYHPFNLLVADHGTATVLDWTGALLADPTFDLAFTTLLLEHPPLHAPGPLQPVIGAVGRRLARRFLAAYRQEAPSIDLTGLGWHRAVHGIRILIELASMEQRRPGGAQGHPFAVLRPAAEAAIVRATT
jgi:aminoglycoside phosphotransferase (APT) family kinase protein